MRMEADEDEILFDGVFVKTEGDLQPARVGLVTPTKSPSSAGLPNITSASPKTPTRRTPTQVAVPTPPSPLERDLDYNMEDHDRHVDQEEVDEVQLQENDEAHSEEVEEVG